MIRSFSLGCLAMAAALVLTQAASAQEKLAWTAFDKGDTFYQEMTTETVQNMTVQGMTVKQTQTQTFVMEWKPVKDKHTKDAWVVKQTIKGVKMNINIGGNNIIYDSQEKNPPANPLTDFFNALKDAEFELTINKEDMKITNIKGRTEFIEKLVKANQQLDALLKQILSEDALKQMADPTFAAIPTDKTLREKGVKKGDKWKRENVVLKMGPIGKYDTTYNYEVTAVDAKKSATIKVDTTLVYSAPETAESGALPFKITKGKLEGKSTGGEIKFDVEKGRIAESTISLELKGTLTIEIAGQPTNVTLDQTQKSTLKTTDKNPLEK